jgi:hypothetical protein
MSETSGDELFERYLRERSYEPGPPRREGLSFAQAKARSGS